MRYIKQIVGSLEKCYALSSLSLNGSEYLLAAAEKHDACYLIGKAGIVAETVMDEPGGVMTMVPVPGRDAIFYCTHKFYSPNDSAKARLDCIRKSETGWSQTTVTELPFVHRFDLIPAGDLTYIIACTLKSGHEYKNDWRFPGKIFTGVLCSDSVSPFSLSEFKTGLGHNHGYTRYVHNGMISAIISCDEGVYKIDPPAVPGSDWTCKLLLDVPCSDAACIDLDGDGLPELLTISPFHGDTLTIWHLADGNYEKIYEHPEKMPFLHAICSGDVYGRPTVYVGNREGDRQLLGFYYDKSSGTYAFEEADRDSGAANCMLFERDGHPAILAANREINEIAIYDIYVG